MQPEGSSVIARLRGKPAANTPEGLVLDVGGVGYLVHATPTAVRKGDSADEITVETYLHVREDALQLYGFADRSERELFIQLLAVSGIGPKVALAIVAGSPVADLRRAIVRGDSARFQAIPGIGKKTAERIVLELKDRLKDVAVAPEAEGAQPSTGDRLRNDLISALENLGYHRPLAEKAVDATRKADVEATFEDALRGALRELMR
jgi:Holliday junction DNA helicase RuvA